MDQDASTHAQDAGDPRSSGLGEPSHATLPPVAIPDHELLRCIGRGSYGSVWLARHTMGMYRAVKFVSRQSFKQDGPFQRELSGIRKFEPISRSHEGFIDVLHVGIDPRNRHFYYVMELGDDQFGGQKIQADTYAPRTLTKDISLHGRLPFQRCLELGLSLSQALAELHRHGLVHRDIKPSNIIFANGVPKLADIGLVAEMSEARSFVGTEGFIPPEGPGTPQADVFSLGKLLYEASTGRDRQDFPELPTRLDEMPECREFLELNEVILQACRTDPRERYQTAWEMHADLLVLANGRSVRRLRLLERRWAKFKRLTGATALLALLGLGITWQGYREWRRASDTRQQQVGANVALGVRAAESGDRLAALPYFAKAVSLDQGNREREPMHRLRFGSALAQCPKLERLWFMQDEELNDVCFEPGGDHALVTSWEGQTRLLNLSSGAVATHAFAQGDRLHRAAFSPDGRTVVTAGATAGAGVWRVSDRAPLRTLPHPDVVFSANFSPEGSAIVTGCKDGLVRTWSAENGEPRLTLAGHTDAVLFAAFSPDGKRILSAGRDRTLRLWAAADGSPAAPPFEHSTWVGFAAMSPELNLVATACFDHKARFWDLSTGRRVFADLAHKDAVVSVEFSPDGRLVLTASFDGTACVWVPDRPLPMLVLRHASPVARAAFASDGHHVITACTDGSVRVWSLAGSIYAPVVTRAHSSPDGRRYLAASTNHFQVFETVTGKPVSPEVEAPAGAGFERAELNQDGSVVIAAVVDPKKSTPRQTQLWDADSGRRLGGDWQSTNRVAVVLAQDRRRLLLRDGDFSSQLWNVQPWHPLTPLISFTEPVACVALDRAGQRAAVASDNIVQVWDAARGRLAFGPLLHKQPVKHVEFSPDGQWLLSCCSDSQLKKCSAFLWDMKTGKSTGKEFRHGDGILHAAFSPDGKRLATAGEDFAANVWDPRSGRRLAPPFQHQHQVRVVGFSPGGNGWLLTASTDRTARLWSSGTGEALTPPLQHSAPLEWAGFLPDGHSIVTRDASFQASVWELPVDTRPAEDLALLSSLLFSDPDNPPDDGDAANLAEAAWQRLRARYPADFAASPEEIAAWDDQQAGESEQQKHWGSAVFHLQRLAQMRPEDTGVARRLANAQARTAR